MNRAALISTLMALLVLLPVPAKACLPPLALSPGEQAAHDLVEQSRAWADATTVYVARVADIRVFESSAEPGARPPTYHLEIFLSAEVVLKGMVDEEDRGLPVLVTPSCIASDIARARIDDRFIVYSGSEGPSFRSGIVSFAKLRHPDALDALARATADIAPGPPERSPPHQAD